MQVRSLTIECYITYKRLKTSINSNRHVTRILQASAVCLIYRYHLPYQATAEFFLVWDTLPTVLDYDM